MEIVITLAVATAALVLVGAVDFLLNEVLFPGEEVPPLPPEEVIDQSLMNATDRKKIQKSKEILEDHLGTDPVDNLITMNAQDRVDAIGNLVEDLTRLYNIKIDGVEFSASLPETVAGCYIRNRRLIQLNIQYLMNDNHAVLRDLLDTIFHELRHAIQWDIVVNGTDGWGVTEQYRQDLAANFKNYIRFERDIHAYQLQLVERDAVTFAACVLS